MEPDLAVVAARVGGRVMPDVLGVMEMAAGAAMLAAFSKSSTCREAGRLLLPPVRPLNCCALDLYDNEHVRVWQSLECLYRLHPILRCYLSVTKDLPNVETHFYCPQAFLSVHF